MHTMDIVVFSFVQSMLGVLDMFGWFLQIFRSIDLAGTNIATTFERQLVINNEYWVNCVLEVIQLVAANIQR